MKPTPLIITTLTIFLLATSLNAADSTEEGFLPLFHRHSLEGWTPQNPDTANAFKVEDNAILCNGDFTHLFYSGPIHNHDFKDFELRAEFKVAPSSNSGIFFHTENPGGKAKVVKGYECQICPDSYTKD